MFRERVLGGKIVTIRAEMQVKDKRVASEVEVLNLIKKGNKEAYGIIVKNYMKNAYYIALGLVHNHQDALDLSQEAFIKAYRNLKRFDLRKPFFPWFYMILRNLCLDHLKRNTPRLLPLEDVEDSSGQPKKREIREALAKGLAQLPFDQREVIVLRYFRQLSYQEMAEILDRPAGTIMSSLYYAKKRLKRILAHYLGFDKD
ncbi:MAG: RNA polymerase sigma factor [Candidatus Aminicenantales bacterium]